MQDVKFTINTLNTKLQITVWVTPKLVSEHQSRMDYSSQPANTTMHVCCQLTVEHPIQIIKGFIDIWRLGPFPWTLKQIVAVGALRATLHPTVAEPTWWRIEQDKQGRRCRQWKIVGGEGFGWKVVKGGKRRETVEATVIVSSQKAMISFLCNPDSYELLTTAHSYCLGILSSNRIYSPNTSTVI